MYKVLVVENNPALVKLLSHFFQREGCDIRLVHNGLQAMSVLDSFTPDILFTDVILPKIGGDVLCRIVRTTPTLKDIFIVIYSAVAYEDEKQIFDLDADLYITKGAKNTVADHIRHVLDRFRNGKRRENIHGKEQLHLRYINDKLMISRRHYNTMMENLSEAVIEMDSTGRIVQANRAAQDLLRRDSAALFSRRLTEYLAGPELDLVEQWFARVATGGSLQFLSSYANPLLAGDRQVLLKIMGITEKDDFFIIAILQDITERRHIEQQLQVFNDELERRVEQRTRELQETQSQYLHAEKLSAIGKLSASIAHEFNSPLQCVTTVLKGLKHSAALEEKGDKALLDLAIGESDRLKNLIRRLQDYNRPNAGRKVPMDVHAAIDALLLLCKSDFRRKKIITVLNYCERMPQIQAIPDQIKHVFLNLLNNAADACIGKGGMITISTSHEEARIAVMIQDNGVGITPEKLDLIFQPFYTTKATVKGAGLGLSVCHGIVRYHDGDIRVESKPGEGSTFTVMLPVKGE